MDTEKSKQLDAALQLGTDKYYDVFDTAQWGDSLEPGSMPADGLYERWIDTYKPEIAIEVGSFLGYSAIKMAKEIKRQNLPTKLICVDTWLGSPEHYVMFKGTPPDNRLGYKFGYPTMYYKFISNVILHGVQDVIYPFPYPSSTAAKILSGIFGKLELKADFIFLDGSHEQNDVALDLFSYYPLLKKGGVMWGDDWAWSGVNTAVSSFVKENEIESNLSLLNNNVHWLIQG